MDKDSFAAREANAEIEIAQPGSINSRIRNCIWNLFHDHILPEKNRRKLCVEIRRYMHLSVDDAPYNDYECQVELKSRFVSVDVPWYEPYDLLEFSAFKFRFPPPGNLGLTRMVELREIFSDTFNNELARAGSAYRFVDCRLTPITSQAEAEELSKASNVPDKFQGAREHVRAGLASLAKKPEPEVRNCIEEALHAVESALKIATGITSGGVRDAVAEFAKQHGIHGALQEAIAKLYGYASNKPGLRHPLLDEPNDLTTADARMMIVMASSIVNWVVSKDAGLES